MNAFFVATILCLVIFFIVMTIPNNQFDKGVVTLRYKVAVALIMSFLLPAAGYLIIRLTVWLNY